MIAVYKFVIYVIRHKVRLTCTMILHSSNYQR